MEIITDLKQIAAHLRDNGVNVTVDYTPEDGLRVLSPTHKVHNMTGPEAAAYLLAWEESLEVKT